MDVTMSIYLLFIELIADSPSLVALLQTQFSKPNFSCPTTFYIETSTREGKSE